MCKAYVSAKSGMLTFSLHPMIKAIVVIVNGDTTK
jgi:hypothetical protein